MNGNRSEIDVGEGDGSALTLQGSEGFEVVEDIFGEVSGDGGGVLVRNGRNEDAVAEEELEVDREC